MPLTAEEIRKLRGAPANDLGGGIDPYANDPYTQALTRQRAAAAQRTNVTAPASAYTASGISQPVVDPLAAEPAGSPTRIAAAQATLTASEAVRAQQGAIGGLNGQGNMSIVTGGDPVAQARLAASQQSPSFAQTQREHMRAAQNIHPIPVQNLDPALMILAPKEASNVLHGAHLKPGQIADIGGIEYRVGVRSHTPVVFDENEQRWVDRDPFIEQEKQMNPRLSKAWGDLQAESDAIQKWAATPEQKAEVLAKVERRKQELAQKAISGAIPRKTPQQQFDENVVTVDGVKGLFVEGKFTPIHPAKDKPTVPGTNGQPVTPTPDPEKNRRDSIAELNGEHKGQAGYIPTEQEISDKMDERLLRIEAYNAGTYESGAHGPRQEGGVPQSGGQPGAVYDQFSNNDPGNVVVPDQSWGNAPPPSTAHLQPQKAGQVLTQEDADKIIRHFNGDMAAARAYAIAAGWKAK